jgi:hypothetical protein
MICLGGGVLYAQNGGGPGPSGNSGSGSGGGSAVKQVALFVPNESAPPGGVAQMKFMVTEPTPISTGRPVTYYDSVTFDGVWGIELFNPSGDVNGVAMVNQNQIQLRYETSNALQGTDYPVMTMALHVRPNAVPGTQTLFSLDPSSSWILGALGSTTTKPAPPATISVRGSISITNVVPGGGLLPAGTVVRIEGLGFQSKTQVQLNAIKSNSILVASPTEIDFTLAQDTNMTGQKIQVVNPDGSQDTYFSYLRGIPLGASNQPLLASATPVFSSNAYSSATFAPVRPALASQFTGIALQNSQLAAVNVTVALYSASGGLLGSSVTALPGGYRMMRDMAELTQGAIAPAGSYLTVTASQPVQVFGFTGDYAVGAVTPFPAVSTRP